MDVKDLQFELFRYQLLPISQSETQSLFERSISVDDIRSNKNKYFLECLDELKEFQYRQSKLNHQIIYKEGSWRGFKLATNKVVSVDTENFETEEVDDWPHVVVLINNDDDKQVFAISKNRKAFWSSSVVASIINQSINPYLRSYGLAMHVEPITEKNQFWHIVEENKNRITNVKFELISPNMANISKVLKLELGQLNRDTNSHRTDLSLNGPDGGPLQVSKENEMLNGLVKYSELGGGDISVKVKDIRNKISTSKSVQKITINELTIENLNESQLDHFITPLIYADD